MCLIIETQKSFIAEEDVHCFKILESAKRDISYITFKGDQVFLKEGDIATPYYHKKITKSVLDGKRCFKAKGEKDVHPYFIIGDFYSVQGGYIHTFNNISSAKKEIAYLKIEREDVELFIFECIIPKGTEYYEGAFDGLGSMNSYASEKIRFIKKVEV